MASHYLSITKVICMALSSTLSWQTSDYLMLRGCNQLCPAKMLFHTLECLPCHDLTSGDPSEPSAMSYLAYFSLFWLFKRSERGCPLTSANPLLRNSRKAS